jgi:hypothetical protein
LRAKGWWHFFGCLKLGCWLTVWRAGPAASSRAHRARKIHRRAIEPSAGYAARIAVLFNDKGRPPSPALNVNKTKAVFGLLKCNQPEFRTGFKNSNWASEIGTNRYLNLSQRLPAIAYSEQIPAHQIRH